jgi:hypothetical protein
MGTTIPTSSFGKNKIYLFFATDFSFFSLQSGDLFRT